MKKFNRCVLDANVFVKIILAEDDSPQAQALLHHCGTHDISIFQPSHFIFEYAQTCVSQGYTLDRSLAVFALFESELMQTLHMSRSLWLSAERISNSGNPKSGFPSLFDSIYHAFAIENDAVFITADQRHIAKTKSFGHIALLKDWKTALSGAGDFA